MNFCLIVSEVQVYLTAIEIVTLRSLGMFAKCKQCAFKQNETNNSYSLRILPGFSLFFFLFRTPLYVAAQCHLYLIFRCNSEMMRFE